MTAKTSFFRALTLKSQNRVKGVQNQVRKLRRAYNGIPYTPLPA